MRELLKSVAAGVVLTVELAYLGSVLWRQIDPSAPEPGELVERFYRELQERARYRAAIVRTLDSIRNLPETETEL